MAEKAAFAETRFQAKVEAFTLVIPPDTPPGQIEVRLGTRRIPATDVNDFMRDILHAEEPRWSRSGGQFGARSPSRAAHALHARVKLLGALRYVSRPAECVLET